MGASPSEAKGERKILGCVLLPVHILPPKMSLVKGQACDVLNWRTRFTEAKYNVFKPFQAKPRIFLKLEIPFYITQFSSAYKWAKTWIILEGV